MTGLEDTIRAFGADALRAGAIVAIGIGVALVAWLVYCGLSGKLGERH